MECMKLIAVKNWIMFWHLNYYTELIDSFYRDTNFLYKNNFIEKIYCKMQIRDRMQGQFDYRRNIFLTCSSIFSDVFLIKVYVTVKSIFSPTCKVLRGLRNSNST